MLHFQDYLLILSKLVQLYHLRIPLLQGPLVFLVGYHLLEHHPEKDWCIDYGTENYE